MQRTAIIGFGCAGFHAAKSMREHGYDGEIHIYSNTDAPPANPMLTTYYVTGALAYEGMFPFGALDVLQEEYGLIIHRNEPVAALDSAQRKLTLRDGRTAFFDHVVLATGASALVPPIPGVERPGVFCMRTVEDAARLRERLDQGVRSAVVIGASMVGIKLVELLHKRGISVTLADMAPHILPTAALPEVAAEIEDRLTAQGISLCFSRPIEAIEGAENGLEVCLGGGQRLPCDIALLCIGTRANTQLADDGIRVGRGIVVNDRMETSAPGIYAAGDCCEGNNLLTGQTQIIGLWDNAARQGETAGANIAGVQPSASYPGNITHNITHFMDMDFIGLGDIRMQGERRTFPLPDRRGRVDLVVQNGLMVCVNILDQYRISGVLKHFLLKSLTEPGAELRPTALGRLEREHVPHALIDYLEGLN